MTRDDAIALLRGVSSRRTICEVHREIYDACAELPEPVRGRLRELVIDAFIMGKKMGARLHEYKANWDEGFFEANHDRQQDKARRRAA